MPGRSITHNLIVAFETIYHIMKKQRGRDGEVSLKLDIGKAYDRVNCHFLKKVCKVWAFGVIR